MKRPNGQARAGQARSGLVMSGHAKFSGTKKKHIQHSACYNEVNWAIEPRVITVDTQIASGHLSIFAVYLHIETGISESFKVPAILFGTLHGDVLLMICAKKKIFEEAKVFKNAIFYFDLERSKVIQRS